MRLARRRRCVHVSADATAKRQRCAVIIKGIAELLDRPVSEDEQAAARDAIERSKVKSQLVLPLPPASR